MTESSTRNVLPLYMGYGLLTKVLSTQLYRDRGQCLGELWRNAVVACMPNKSSWEPGVGVVEINLFNKYPSLTEGRLLTVMDRGSGIIGLDEGDQRFGILGRTSDELKNASQGVYHDGASEKGIGRFSALALCEDTWKASPAGKFYVFTRTAESGSVNFMQFTPENIDRREIPVERIPDDDRRLGTYQQSRLAQSGERLGSFTVIAIPNPVFGSVQEIVEAIIPYLPAHLEKMSKLLVNGEAVKIPDLPTRVVDKRSDSEISFYLDRADQSQLKGEELKRAGIWLADAKTGLRVANASEMSDRHIPSPIFHPSLAGVIFIPGLLSEQNSSRTGLNPRFLAQARWTQVKTYLELHVSPIARQLLDGEEIFTNENPVDRSMRDLATVFFKVMGDPEQFKKTGKTTGAGHGGGGIGRKGGKPSEVFKIVANDTAYSIIRNTSEDPRVIFRGMLGTDRIHMNPNYVALPRRQPERLEHMLVALLSEVANLKKPDDHDFARNFIGEMRRKFPGIMTAK